MLSLQPSQTHVFLFISQLCLESSARNHPRAHVELLHCWVSRSKQEDKRKVTWPKQTFWNTPEPQREANHRGITDLLLRVRQRTVILSRTTFPKPLSFQSAPDERVAPALIGLSSSFLPSRVQDRELWVLFQQRLLHQVQVWLLPTQRALLW